MGLWRSTRALSTVASARVHGDRHALYRSYPFWSSENIVIGVLVEQYLFQLGLVPAGSANNNEQQRTPTFVVVRCQKIQGIRRLVRAAYCR
jgi:hypothetical protein